jgi:hypothetical protein
VRPCKWAQRFEPYEARQFSGVERGWRFVDRGGAGGGRHVFGRRVKPSLASASTPRHGCEVHYVCVLLAASGLLCEIVDLSGTARRVQLVYKAATKVLGRHAEMSKCPFLAPMLPPTRPMLPPSYN